MKAEPPRFSVIVASRDRPDCLRRCLRAVASLDYPSFELIVAADPDSLATVETGNAKTITVPEPGIAKARNAGIVQAAGEICAFIDDDAVPEPTWLTHLADAFRVTGADAVTGYVRGRNGISFQSQVASVDAEAETHSEIASYGSPFVPNLAPGRALKLIGTNMAIRRDVLTEVAGFDQFLEFYLDDADLSLRLARAGRSLAVAPLAEVHHAFAASPRRTALRAPIELHEIGRSTAIFLRRHLGRADPEFLDRLLTHQRARLLRHMVAGTCEPRDVPIRLAGLVEGWRRGAEVPLTAWNLPETAPADFAPVPHPPSGHTVLSTRFFLNRRSKLREAEEIAENGARVTLFSFSLTPVRHRLRFTGTGVWLQTGGIWGRSVRSGPRFVWCRFADRLREEIRRVAKVRGFGDI